MLSSFHYSATPPLAISVSDIHNHHHHHHRRHLPRRHHHQSKVVSASSEGEFRHGNRSCNDDTKQRIINMFDNIKLSFSAYDTAFVAMVPSPTSPSIPHFPQSLNWLLQHQHNNGSWGFNSHQPFSEKDLLSSTLASVLSLKKWGVGEAHANRGVCYIQSKFEYAIDAMEISPVGFDVIFPSMIESAKVRNLNLSLNDSHVRTLFQKRDMELKRINGSTLPGRQAYAAYISEGIRGSIDQEMVTRHRRKNGSLFNSPATTAAVATSLLDVGCISYLQKVLEHSGSAVPTVFPLEIYARLCLVDALVRTGIDRYFTSQIQNVLDATYRCWEQEDEEVFLDVTTCAMAFRLLRCHGYKVSPDPLAQYETEEDYLNSFAGHLNDTNAVLELHRASEVITSSDETVLKKINAWSGQFLKQNRAVSTHSDQLKSRIAQEVDDALEFPSYKSMELLENRRYLNIYRSENVRILKTSYSCWNNDNKEIIKLAAEDLNRTQPFLREEFSYMERWVSENRLDKAQFTRQATWNIYFTAASVFLSPELKDARLAWAKSSVVMLLVDDLFDVFGSEDELANFIFLMEKWDISLAKDSCSEEVGILFSAIYRSITEIAESAEKVQGHDVTSHLVKNWLKGFMAMWKDAEWRRNSYLPTVEEYMSTGHSAVVTEPIVQSAAYFVGVPISEEVFSSAEFHKLSEILGTIGRLLNDIVTTERELAEGKVNSLSLRMLYAEPESTKEAVIQEMMEIVEDKRIELRRLILQQDSEVPNAVKQVVWKMCRVLHYFYLGGDSMVAVELSRHIDSYLHDPVLID